MRRISILLVIAILIPFILPTAISASEPIEFGKDSNLSEVMEEYYSDENNEPTYGESYTSNQLISFANWVLRTLGAQDVVLLVFGKNPRADQSDTFLTGGIQGDPRDQLILGIFPEAFWEAISYLYGVFESVTPIWLVLLLVIIGVVLLFQNLGAEERSKTKDYLLAFVICLLALRFGHVIWIIVLQINYFIIDIIWAALQSFGVETGLFLDMIWGAGTNGYESLISVGDTLGIAFLVGCAAFMTFMMNYQYMIRLIILGVLFISFPFAHMMSVFPKYRNASKIWWEEFNLNIFLQSIHAVALGIFFLILAAGYGGTGNTEAVEDKPMVDIFTEKFYPYSGTGFADATVPVRVGYKGEADAVYDVPVTLYVDGRNKETIIIPEIKNGKKELIDFSIPADELEFTLITAEISNSLKVVANDPRVIEEYNGKGDPYANNTKTNGKGMGSTVQYGMSFFLIIAYFFGMPTIVALFRKFFGASDGGQSMMGGLGMILGVSSLMNMTRMFRGSKGSSDDIMQGSPAGSDGGIASDAAPLTNTMGFGQRVLGNKWVKGAAMAGGAIAGSAISTMMTGKGTAGMMVGGIAGKLAGSVGGGVGSMIDARMEPSNQDTFTGRLQEQYMSGKGGFMTKAAVEMGWGAQRALNVATGGRLGSAAVARDSYIADYQQLQQDSGQKMQETYPQLKIAESKYKAMQAQYGPGSEWYQEHVNKKTGRVSFKSMPAEYKGAMQEYKHYQAEYHKHEAKNRYAEHKLTNYDQMKDHINTLDQHQSSSGRGRV